jgi:hypothetical protein
LADIVEAGHFLTDEHGLEEGFGAVEALGADGDGMAVGQLVGFVVLGGFFAG